MAELSEEDIKTLVKRSVDSKEKAYAPYSKFRVGAALMTGDGTIFTGCNVENCAYPLCTCAERCAVVNAVSHGYRDFKAIAVSTDSDSLAAPCGNCRQIMKEFGNFQVIITRLDGSYQLHTVDALLPHSFTIEDLRSGQKSGQKNE